MISDVWKAIPSKTSVTGHEVSGIYAISTISAWKAVVISPRLRHGFLSPCSVASFRRRIVERFTMEIMTLNKKIHHFFVINKKAIIFANDMTAHASRRTAHLSGLRVL